MYSRRQAWIKVAQIVFVGVLVSGVSAQISDFRPRIGMPEDWTHPHIRFSSAAIRQHPEIASREPRAALHLYREALMAAVTSFPDSSTTAAVSRHRDWSINLGTGRIQFGQYPAKWNADPNVAPVYNRCATSPSGPRGLWAECCGCNRWTGESGRSHQSLQRRHQPTLPRSTAVVLLLF
jgi:hypothetical protein